MAVRREVLGDEHVDRAIAGTTEFTADFQDLITRYAWGGDLDPTGPGPAYPQLHYPRHTRRAAGRR
jgi:hypothetical protein